MAKAVRLLAQRSMSEGQIRDRLRSVPETDPTQLEEVIQRLKDRAFLNDRKFGERFAASRTETKPMGRARIAKELASRGLAKTDIEASLDAAYEKGSDAELIDKAIEKRLRVKGHPSTDAEVRRLFAHLARLGFDYDLIASRVRTLRQKQERESGK